MRVVLNAMNREAQKFEDRIFETSGIASIETDKEADTVELTLKDKNEKVVIMEGIDIAEQLLKLIQ